MIFGQRLIFRNFQTGNYVIRYGMWRIIVMAGEGYHKERLETSPV